MKSRIQKEEEHRARASRSPVLASVRWSLVALLVALIVAVPAAVVLGPFFARHPVLSSALEKRARKSRFIRKLRGMWEYCVPMDCASFPVGVGCVTRPEPDSVY